MRRGAVADRRHVRFSQHFQCFFGLDQAQIAAHCQRLGDLHHIFVMHFDVGRRQRLVQHRRAGTAAGDDEKRRSWQARGLAMAHLLRR